MEHLATNQEVASSILAKGTSAVRSTRFPLHHGDASRLVPVPASKAVWGNTPCAFDSRRLRVGELVEPPGFTRDTMRVRGPSALLPFRRRVSGSPTHLAHVAQRRERQVPNLEAGGSIPPGGTHDPVTEWPGAGPQHQSRRFESGRGLDAIHCGRSRESVRVSAAPHTGGPPGSTPGPATAIRCGLIVHRARPESG